MTGRLLPYEHALVLLENGVVPFCHYENPLFHTPAAPLWIDETLLKAVIARARKDGVALTFLLGATRPPAKIEKLINGIAHVKVVPPSLCDDYPDAIVVVSSDDIGAHGGLKQNFSRNVILRVTRSDIPRLAEMFDELEGTFGRLSIHLLGHAYFSAYDLEAYADELNRIAGRLKKLYARNTKIEVNVLTDRMMLKQMRNCDAGEKHVTVAPDGKLYLCPAFLYDGEDAIGTFDEKTGFGVKPPSTVAFARAPLCTRCDAWACKRCVWLNHKLTQEYNVPSEQQCLIAHTEREASRLLLRELRAIDPFRRLPPIGELNYRDPLELIDMPTVEFAVPPADDPML